MADADLAVIEAALNAKLRRRILPLLLLPALMASIDRSNVSFAALSMNADLGLGTEVFGVAAGIFFCGYALFEIPSAAIGLRRFGAQRWLATILLVWGIATCLTAGVSTPATFYLARFLLGVAEAGWVATAFAYIAIWIPRRRRGSIAALFASTTAAGAVVGGPAAAVIMRLHGLGLRGWQWLFLVEGGVTILVAFALLRWMPAVPDQVRWLAEAERRLLAAEAEPAAASHQGIGRTITRPIVLVYATMFFFLSYAYYCLFFFTPLIIRDLLSGISATSVNLMAALPPVCGILLAIVTARHSDRTGDRQRHTVAMLAGSALLLAVSLPLPLGMAKVAAFILATGFAFAAVAMFWVSPMQTLTGPGGAESIAAINSIAALAGFSGPFVTGFLRSAQGGYDGALTLALACLCVAALMPLLFPAFFPRSAGTDRPAPAVSPAGEPVAVPAAALRAASISRGNDHDR